jgi:hypothetical protein
MRHVSRKRSLRQMAAADLHGHRPCRHAHATRRVPAWGSALRAERPRHGATFRAAATLTPLRQLWLSHPRLDDRRQTDLSKPTAARTTTLYATPTARRGGNSAESSIASHCVPGAHHACMRDEDERDTLHKEPCGKTGKMSLRRRRFTGSRAGISADPGESHEFLHRHGCRSVAPGLPMQRHRESCDDA